MSQFACIRLGGTEGGRVRERGGEREGEKKQEKEINGRERVPEAIQYCS